MPKNKTHSGASKRFRVTGTGKIRRQKTGLRHNLEKKSEAKAEVKAERDARAAEREADREAERAELKAAHPVPSPKKEKGRSENLDPEIEA